MNREDRTGRWATTPRCVVMLLLALLIIVSHAGEARAAAVAAPTSLAVTSAASTQINVTWGAAAGASRYQVERAATKAGPFAVVGNPTANSFADTGVAAGSTYVYRVRAIDSLGNKSAYSNTVVARSEEHTSE